MTRPDIQITDLDVPIPWVPINGTVILGERDSESLTTEEDCIAIDKRIVDGLGIVHPI